MDVLLTLTLAISLVGLLAATMELTYVFAAGGVSISKTITQTNGLLTLLDAEAVAADATDTEMTLTLDVSAVKSFYVMCTTGVTIETNSGSTPADTITLRANEPYMWDANDPNNSFALSTDVTSIFVTENDSTAGNLTLAALVDATP